MTFVDRCGTTEILACYICFSVDNMCLTPEYFASMYSKQESAVGCALFGLQGIAASALQAAPGKLHEEYGSGKKRLGVASPATLDCLCNLAQGYCLQGNLSNAEEQLLKALTLLDDQQSRDERQSRHERPIALEVLRIRIMLELADVTVQLER